MERAVVFLSFVFLLSSPVDPLCGPKSLLAICRLFDIPADLEEICKLSGWERAEGTTMWGLYKAAEAKGLHPQGFRLTLEALRKVKGPAIVLVESNHFLAIDGLTSNGVRIISPSEPPYTIPLEEFSHIWKGYALVVARDSTDVFVPREEARAKGPHIVFDHTFFEFTIVEGDTLVHSFHFRNEGSEPLRIRAFSPCGCTSVLAPGGEVPPGGEGEVKVIFYSGATSVFGIIKKRVTVISNDRHEPQISLVLKGTVKPILTIIPQRIDYGDIEASEPTKRTLVLVDYGDTSLKVTGVETSSPYIKARLDSVDSKENRYRIEVTLTPEVPVGRLSERLIVHTNSPRMPVIEVPIEGNVVGKVRVYPGWFFFGAVGRRTLSSEVTLTKADEGGLKISNVEAPEFITVEVVPLKLGMYVLKATLNLNDVTENLRGVVRVHTNDLDQPTLEVPFIVEARKVKKQGKTSEGPDIYFPRKEYDFGEVVQGTMVTHTFPFYNRGDSLLVI
ncbi:MAG TPA: DUF1573 domain-containing protein, partial [Candidatus Latescibacteria bacterium]|nr:DUF1573 domain-containing protein [Candidatus Latescibacterota bacterium]